MKRATGLRSLVFAMLCGALALAATAPVRAAPCTSNTLLSVVAHPDDDLLFMNPDLDDAIASGRCIRTVYLTAGDRGKGLAYLEQREHGLMAAYAAMAHQPDRWRAGVLDVEGRRLVRYALAATNDRIELIMLRIPDPWLGSGWGSLTPLSRLESVPEARVESYGPYRETYTRSQLVALLASLIQIERPQAIHLMDPTIQIAYQALCWRCKGNDHPDHIAGARLMEDAIFAAPGLYTTTSYLDYPSEERAVNLTTAQIHRKAAIFKRYMLEDPHYCPTPPQCEIRGPEVRWVERQYTVVTHSTTTAAAR